MPKKRYNAEEVIHKLREADVLLSQGHSVSQICKQIGVANQTYYRWRKVCGGMRESGPAPTTGGSEVSPSSAGAD